MNTVIILLAFLFLTGISIRLALALQVRNRVILNQMKDINRLKHKISQLDEREIQAREEHNKIGSGLFKMLDAIMTDAGIQTETEEKSISLEDQLKQAIQNSNFELARQIQNKIDSLKN